MRLNRCVCPLFRILFYSYIYISTGGMRVYAKTGLPIFDFFTVLAPPDRAGCRAINHSARITDKRLIYWPELVEYELAGLTRGATNQRPSGSP